jgi:hypothetical protein
MIPLSWLLSASDTSVQNFTLNRMSEAANLRKEAKAIERQAIELEVSSLVATWLFEKREEILRTVGSNLERTGREENAA